MGIVDIINVLVALLAVLEFLTLQPFIPPELIPWLFFGIAALNAVVTLLRALFPQNVLVKSLRR